MGTIASFAIGAIALIYVALWVLGAAFTAMRKTAGSALLAGQKAITNVEAAIRFGLRQSFAVSADREYQQTARRLDVALASLAALQKWAPELAPELRFGKDKYLLSLPVFIPYALPPGRDGLSSLPIDDQVAIRRGIDASAVKRLKRLATASCSYPCRKLVFLTFRLSGEPPSVDSLAGVMLKDASYEIKAKTWVVRQLVEMSFGYEIAEVKAIAQETLKIKEELAKFHQQHSEAQKVVAERIKALRTEFERDSAEMLKRHLEAESNYQQECERQRAKFSALIEGYESGTKAGVEDYFCAVLSLVDLPDYLPADYLVDYDVTMGVIVIDVRLTNLPDVTLWKVVALKSGPARKPAARKEAAQYLSQLHPLHVLRIGNEIALADEREILKAVVINGWVEYRQPSTGHTCRGYTESVMTEPGKLRQLVLESVDPIAAFRALKGVSAFVVEEVVPIKPTMCLRRDDPRFIEGREVLGAVQAATNLATMEWDDFEHLIRQLFEKLFSGEGTEVHITQASRDRGVDAVVLDPDPIRGGKTIIQAKRYSNTVDVAAVRDLYGALMNEGASRGILVTTSDFGADAYQFVRDKPLALINGAGLLAYLKQVGYEARIDLEEARRLNRLLSVN